MRFIDYPDHLPQGPLSPEAAAIFERLKETARRLDIKIVLHKPAPLPLDLDLALESGVLLSRSGTGPLTWIITKNRPARPVTILDTFGACAPDFAEARAKAIERMTNLSKEPSP